MSPTLFYSKDQQVLHSLLKKLVILVQWLPLTGNIIVKGTKTAQKDQNQINKDNLIKNKLFSYKQLSFKVQKLREIFKIKLETKTHDTDW